METINLLALGRAYRIVGGSVAALALLTLAGCQKPVAEAAPPGRRSAWSSRGG